MGYVLFVVIARLKSRLILDDLLCFPSSLCAALLVNGRLIAVVNGDEYRRWTATRMKSNCV